MRYIVVGVDTVVATPTTWATILVSGRDYRSGAGMTMQGRGWRREHSLVAVDTTGKQHMLIAGVTTDAEGHLVPVFAVDDGPTIVIEPVYEGAESAKLALLMMHTLLDHQDLLTKQQIERGGQ